ncbi:MAG: hypothetical protein F4Y45_04165 [Acidobacteria bacterium]|nr:hypothetical protein [Acidobacteriota bacterium]MYJ05961.1 hypothetical protein [Acidobacteriota bacterium]
MKTFLLFPGILLVAGLAACGDSSPTAPTTTPTRPTTPTTDADELMPTLSSIQSLIFNESCLDHHGDHAVEGELDLSEGMSYAELVNMPSIQVLGLNRVEPNDAENSYLIHKLEDRASIVGNRMPPAGLLTTEQIDTIKEWINNGAQNN